MWIKLDNTELKEVDNFKYFGDVLKRDGNCTREIYMRIAMAKEGFNRKQIKHLTQEEIGQVLYLVYCIVRLRHLDTKKFGALKCGVGR